MTSDPCPPTPHHEEGAFRQRPHTRPLDLTAIREAIGRAFLAAFLAEVPTQKAEAIRCLEGATAFYLAAADEAGAESLDSRHLRWSCAWAVCMWCNGEGGACPCECHARTAASEGNG